MAALPQCIQSAKELYDLRSRYKDASVLITAIYSESMVIAASLSQVQTLLHHDALQSKPQLLETFDLALTGCRVVYGCLEEEVRDLVLKAENDGLSFKDRAKFLWKEETFKELLTQIRGQQSALSLLIQGLQMESIADIRKLVKDNSVTLDQVVKRSRTLRESHPRLKIPESVFSKESQIEDATDADSIVRSADFAFDDEVINSKAYRRAMALYTSQNETKTPRVAEKELVDDDVTAFESANQVNIKQGEDMALIKSPTPTSSPINENTSERELNEVEEETSPKSEENQKHQDLFDSLEQDILAYMPRNTSTAPYLTTFKPDAMKTPIVQNHKVSTPAPLRSFSEGYQLPTCKDFEDVPPLLPRRPSGPLLRSEEYVTTTAKVQSASSDDSICTTDTPSTLSKVSTASSFTAYDSSLTNSTISRRPLRKPLPLEQKASQGALSNLVQTPPERESPVMRLTLQSPEMQSIWLSFVDAERKFVERMTTFRKMFYDNIIRQWPLLEKHLEAILIGEQLANLNNEIMLQAMEQQTADNRIAVCDPKIFETWTNKSHKLYREYCQRMPHAASSLRTTQSLDLKFSPFVNTLGLSIAYFGMGWEDYLRLPNVHLQSYVDNLQSLVNVAESLGTSESSQALVRLKRGLDAVTWLRTLTSALLEDAQNRENVQNLEKRIQTLDANILSELCLREPTRRVRHQCGMAIKLKSQGPWVPVHVMLLDNYLLWGKAKPPKKGKGDRILVLDAPIAISDLQITLPCDSHQFQKATMFDEIPRGSVVYIITFKSNKSETKPHMLGALSFQDRKVWWDHLTGVVTKHEAAL
ncbi:hypothetical protein BKA66DRAFT_434941 [Pyrenochaeta sp. MPI-SDFR-AT-0127]|nr:hypothetical protein BKA66DRAFT_434941 [Pyrenochaeta sp. MPI-SDFR-AT-0127]